MEKNILDIQQEKKNLESEVSNWFQLVNERLKTVPDNFENKIELLVKIRQDVYEEMNQIQHAATIISAAEKFQQEFPQINKWTWHPKQTSHKDYADLTGFINNKVFLNAEITTSLKPKGTTDKRMFKTLESLSNKGGKKFYIVKTDEMKKRAETKICKSEKWNIETRKI